MHTGVSITQGDRAGQFRHEALMYDGSSELLEQTSRFIVEGLDASEPTFVVIDSATISALGARIGPHPLLSFADMAVVGGNPARIIPAWRSFVDEHEPGRPLRGIGQPVWAERTPQELAECERHESLLNLAFADSANMWLMCPYDVSTLDAATVQAAERTHPSIADRRGRRASDGYQGLDAARAPFQAPLPEPPLDASAMPFDADALPQIRAWATDRATTMGLAGSRTDDLVLALGEVAANSIRHGGGRGTLRVWSDHDAVVCEVRDAGAITDPLAGRTRPDPDQEGGFGLWLANQLCDLVQIRVIPGGSVVRLHVRLG
ncbi:MAG TPA: sensor histidine kinase [Actinomycetota bacterium]|nr:sensor histidine kinase [Actinomycetota bacterium]